MSESSEVTFTAAAWSRLAEAVRAAPYGYLLGRGVLAGRQVFDVVAGAEPSAGDPGSLVLPPSEWIRCETDAHRRRWDILGVYQVVNGEALVPHARRHAAVDQGLVLCLVAGETDGDLRVACFEREEGGFPSLTCGRE